jgi:hypothetical protein
VLSIGRQIGNKVKARQPSPLYGYFHAFRLPKQESPATENILGDSRMPLDYVE